MNGFSIHPATRQGIKKPSIVGHNNPRWKGGEIRTRDNRVMCYSPDHPHPSKGRYVYRYRLVIERHIGRFLMPSEIVHHRNHVCDDDRLENLELTTAKAHNTHHAHDLQIKGKWSRKFDRCVSCGTTEARHKGNGLCTQCNDKKRWPERSRRQHAI